MGFGVSSRALPKIFRIKPNTSVYVCITGLVRWAGKYIAKDDVIQMYNEKS
jgi:hypothetical protein